MIQCHSSVSQIVCRAHFVRPAWTSLLWTGLYKLSLRFQDWRAMDSLPREFRTLQYVYSMSTKNVIVSIPFKFSTLLTRTANISAHLVSNSFLRWKDKGIHLWKPCSQVVVKLPELSITPVHIPLIIQDADVDLRTDKHININIIVMAISTTTSSMSWFLANLLNLKIHILSCVKVPQFISCRDKIT